MQNVENLLSQVKTINESSKLVAEATGDNFNIFSVLKIEHYEVRTHSLFLAELLNPNGSHGFKDEFLKTFIDHLNIGINFKTVGAKVYLEHYLGKIDVNSRLGGQIDILLEDENKNRIIIENKIYAGEQPNQLERYFNFDNKAKIFFLTLFKDNSRNHNKFDKYTPISYENFIVNWIEKCHQQAVENPVVRETLKQYKHLVKKLTNQNINSKMENELIKLILKNNDETLSIVNTYNRINVEKLNKLNFLFNYAKENKIVIQNNIININPEYRLNFSDKLFPWQGYKVMRFDFFITKDKIIAFEFNSKENYNLYFFIFSNSKLVDEIIKNNFKDDLEMSYDYFTENDKLISDLEERVYKILNFLNENCLEQITSNLI